MKHLLPLFLLITLLLISCQDEQPETTTATPNSGASVTTDLANPLITENNPNAHPILDRHYGRQLLGLEETIVVSEEKFSISNLSDVMKPDINAAFTRTPWLYTGKWSNGIGYVGLGPDMGDTPILKAINQDSIGIFFATVTAPAPTTAAEAQALIFTQYPNLSLIDVHPLLGEGLFSFYLQPNPSPYTFGDGSVILNNEIIMYGVNEGDQPEELILWVLLVSGKSSEQFR